MFEIIILMLIFSIDSFLVSISYSIKNIYIKSKFLFLISLINVLSIFLSYYFGSFILLFVPKNLFKFVSFIILLCLGLYNVFQDKIKSVFKTCNNRIVQIVIDETKADFDNSYTLSLKETLFLAISLSIDSFIGGISIIFNNIYVLLIMVFLINIIMLFLGKYLGNKLYKLLNINISLISGLIIIIIAIFRFI